MIALEQLKQQNCVKKLKTNITFRTIPQRSEDLFEFLYDQATHIMVCGLYKQLFASMLDIAICRCELHLLKQVGPSHSLSICQ